MGESNGRNKTNSEYLDIMIDIYLIANADDFGLNESITDAIIESHESGFLTSTTLMANMSGCDYAVKKGREYKELGVGIHFTLTEGKPVSSPNKIPLLLNPETGDFIENIRQRKNFLFPNKEMKKQVMIELEAQLTKLLDLGCTPSHFDSHHHITGLPVAFSASAEVAKKYGVTKARMTNTSFHFRDNIKLSPYKKLRMNLPNFPKAYLHKKNKVSLRNQGFLTPDMKILPSLVLPKYEGFIDQFINTLSVLKKGVTEISFHPGFDNSYPSDSDSFAKVRVNDLKVLTNEEVIQALKNLNIKMINFRYL